MGVPDDMTDDRWQREAPTLADGWVAGRVRVAKSDKGAFGWCRGSFGIFEGDLRTPFGAFELTSLTHLKSGKRIAMFNGPEHAATAAELAERVGDWSEIDENGLVTEAWQQRARQMHALWESAGLMPVDMTGDGRAVWCGREPGGREAVH